MQSVLITPKFVLLRQNISIVIDNYIDDYIIIKPQKTFVEKITSLLFK
jgi:hypothetical protein